MFNVLEKSKNILLHFEAHRERTKDDGPNGALVFVSLEGTRGGGPSNSYLTFSDTSSSFYNAAHWEDPNEGDYGNWFCLNGSFVLPDDFDETHPVFRALVALGFDAEKAIEAIREAIACAKDEVRDE